MKPSELLNDNDRLVAHLDVLPYQEGRPLSLIREEGTGLVNYSSDEHTSHSHIYMAKIEAVGSEYNDKLPDQISAAKDTANTGNKDDAQRDAHRLKNQKRATRRRNAAERQRQVHHNLDATFVGPGERGFRTLIANIASAIAILASIQDLATQQALRLAKRAWLQLDQ